MERNHSVRVGDIFCATWGYDQTNVDYFVVVRLAGRTMVEVQQIAAVVRNDPVSGWIAGTSVPDPDRPFGDLMRRKVNTEGGNPGIRIYSFKYAFPWDGKERSWTRTAEWRRIRKTGNRIL